MSGNAESGNIGRRQWRGGFAFDEFGQSSSDELIALAECQPGVLGPATGGFS
jgi:hypothetical protein